MPRKKEPNPARPYKAPFTLEHLVITVSYQRRCMRKNEEREYVCITNLFKESILFNTKYY